MPQRLTKAKKPKIIKPKVEEKVERVESPPKKRVVEKQDVRTLNGVFLTLNDTNNRLVSAILTLQGKETELDNLIRKSTEEKLSLVKKKEELVVLEGQLNRKLKYTNMVSDMEKVKKYCVDERHRLEIEKGEWGQAKLDRTREISEEESDRQNRLGELRDKENLLKNQQREFNEWKEKYGKLEGFGSL